MHVDERDGDIIKLVDAEYEGERGHYLRVFGDEVEEGPGFLVRDDGPDAEYRAAAVGLTPEQAVFLGNWLINKYS